MNCDMNSSNFIAPMNYFERLLEGCIFEIVSKTTSADAVRSIGLSRVFKFLEESDEIWGRFLPHDYQEIIDRSMLPIVCNTKKELFFSLCDSPILLDGGKMSFFLDKHSGRKCFMIAPKELIISESDNTYSWQWSGDPDSRFSEVAYLGGAVLQLDIRGTIGTEMLSPKTEYAAYLVFKLINGFNGIIYAKSSIRFVNYESESDADNQANTVHLAILEESGDIPKMRGDGWMEVKLGYFNSKEGTDGPVEARLIEKKRFYKGGLIVEGIEFRPK